MRDLPHWTVKNIPDQSGKTAIITGANSGIGYYTALELARAGSKIILACRNLEKAGQARQLILQEVPQADIEISELDLSNLKSVEVFSNNFLHRGGVLDVLINNAGIWASQKRMLTHDGFELQFGTNVLGHFALTGRLMPALSKATAGRIVSVSSVAHRRAKINFDDLQAEKSYSPMKVYGQSKLANAVFGVELHNRLMDRKENVFSIIAHPGIAQTDILTNTHQLTPTLQSRLASLLTPFVAQSGSQGALPSLYAATEPEAKAGKYYGPHGLYAWRGYPTEEKFDKSLTDDPEQGERLWPILESLSGVKFLS